MPSYNDKYKNDRNAANYRHLLGGRKEGDLAQNQQDISNSTVQWQMDLRYYNPKKDRGTSKVIRKNITSREQNQRRLK